MGESAIKIKLKNKQTNTRVEKSTQGRNKLGRGLSPQAGNQALLQ